MLVCHLLVYYVLVCYVLCASVLCVSVLCVMCYCVSVLCVSVLCVNTTQSITLERRRRAWPPKTRVDAAGTQAGVRGSVCVHNSTDIASHI